MVLFRHHNSHLHSSNLAAPTEGSVPGPTVLGLSKLPRVRADTRTTAVQVALRMWWLWTSPHAICFDH